MRVWLATEVRTNVSLTYTAGYTRRNAERKMPWGIASDQSAASGTRYLPFAFFRASRPLTFTLMVCVVPGAAYAVMSKFDGVKAVVWVPTTRPSTDSVAWWLTAPNSIHTDCGCPESGTVMVREYTASFTSVKPCLYQPPPGTVIDVAARPAGVKPHVPARSTDPIAALPAVRFSGLAVVAAVAAVAAKRGRPNTAATPTPVANSRRRVSWCWCSGTESETGITRASYRRVHFWLLPPLQVHSSSGVPLAAPAPVASRQSPDWTPVMLPSACTVHS